MIKCIAIDDEPLALTQLAGYIARIPYLTLVASCRDAFEAMKLIGTEKIDLLFIDINMPDLNGLEFVRSLTERPLVVFTTACPEYAIEGFRLDAVDYLLKPFGFRDLLLAAEKVRKRWEYEKGEVLTDSALYIRNNHRVRRVQLDEIKYIEGMSEFVRIYLEGCDKPLMPLLSIKRLEEVLPPLQFMRVHRSYIVNLKKITEISHSRILCGNTYIPLGDLYKEKFHEFINGKVLH